MFGRFWRKYAWIYIPGLLCLAVYCRLSTRIPEALGDAIDLLESGSATYDGVVRAALLLVELAVFSFFMRNVFRLCMFGNSRFLECEMRESFFVKLQSLPVGYFGKQRSGDLIAYAINDINAVRQMLGPTLAVAGRCLLLGVFSIAAMIAEVDPSVTVWVLFPVPFTVVIVVFLGSVVRRRFTRVQEMFSRISGFVNESIMGAKIIKSFSREEEWGEDYRKVSDEMREANISLVRASSLLGPSITVAFGISYALSLILGGKMVLAGTMTVGQLVAYEGYLALVKRFVVQISQIINAVVRGSASMKRLREIFDVPSVSRGELEGEKISFTDKIEFKNLTFRYEEGAEPALENVSFTLKKGTTVGVTGPTGCGKTTIVSLLLKLYDVPRGTVFVDGTDLCDLPAYSMRALCGYVPQDSFLFSDSIKNNVAFYSPRGNDETVRAATHIASIDPDDRTVFADGYDTEVGERGTHLSGGQKQRLSLARALVRDPEILICDDTLSAVDSVTEKTIKERLAAYFEGRTVLLISQKLSAIADCDQILYLEDGKIAECGTHAELIARGGGYAALWEKQCADADADNNEKRREHKHHA